MQDNPFQIYQTDGWQEVSAHLIARLTEVSAQLITNLQTMDRKAAVRIALTAGEEVLANYKAYGTQDGEVYGAMCSFFNRKLKIANYTWKLDGYGDIRERYS